MRKVTRVILCQFLLLMPGFGTEVLNEIKANVRDAFFSNGVIPRLKIRLDEKAIASLKQDSH